MSLENKQEKQEFPTYLHMLRNLKSLWICRWQLQDCNSMPTVWISNQLLAFHSHSNRGGLQACWQSVHRAWGKWSIWKHLSTSELAWKPKREGACINQQPELRQCWSNSPLGLQTSMKSLSELKYEQIANAHSFSPKSVQTALWFSALRQKSERYSKVKN